VIAGDVMDTEKLSELMKGNDAVVSAYNPGWSNPDIYNEFLKGSLSIQAAVKRSGIKRLITLGGAGSSYIAPNLQLIDTPEFPAEWKAGALAARDYLNILRKEDQLDWAFVTPAIEMHPGTSGVRKGVYRTGLENPVFDENKKSIISVEDVAVAVVDELEKPKHIRQRFTVAY
jgi:putative NADH-flavin reductase